MPVATARGMLPRRSRISSTRASSTGLAGRRGARLMITSRHVAPEASTPVIRDLVPTSTEVRSALNSRTASEAPILSHWE